MTDTKYKIELENGTVTITARDYQSAYTKAEELGLAVINPNTKESK